MILRIGKINRGFTLVEVLISVVVLGLGISIVLRSYFSSLSALDASQNNIYALNFAKIKLDELIVEAYEKKGLTENSTSGKFDSGSREFNWVAEVGQIVQPVYLNDDMVAAKVNVSWKERNQERNLVIATFLPKYKEKKEEQN